MHREPPAGLIQEKDALIKELRETNEVRQQRRSLCAPCPTRC